MLSLRKSTDQRKKLVQTLKKYHATKPLVSDHFIHPGVVRFSKPIAFEELFMVSDQR